MLFFFNDTATTEIYTLSLHDALPIWLTTTAWSPLGGGVLTGKYTEAPRPTSSSTSLGGPPTDKRLNVVFTERVNRSEEHTSELQSRLHLVCRLLLEKKNIQSKLSQRI